VVLAVSVSVPSTMPVWAPMTKPEQELVPVRSQVGEALAFR